MRDARGPALILLVFLLLGSPPVVSGQSQPIQYGFDEIGRLVVVVDGSGSGALYVYDDVGNLTAIQRVDVPGAVGIVAVVPARGAVGATVSILGKGFSASPAENTVSFNSGVTAAVSAASPTRLTVTVPPSALNGPVSVTTPLGSATWAGPFVVLGPPAISPTTATLSLGASQQFTATFAGGGSPPAAWSVNGVPGGNSSVGTVSATGLYTAPSFVPQPTTVKVTVTDTSDALLPSASAEVLVLAQSSTRFSAAAAVSVTLIGLRQTIYNSVTSAVTVMPPSPISVRGVSAPIASVWVSDRRSTTAVSTPASATFAPVVTAVSPAAAGVGASNVSLTLTGSGLTGATAVNVLLNGTADGTVTVTDLSVNGDGTEATALMSIASNAATGLRVMQIVTPGGPSTPFNTGGNSLTVQ